jgi:hypothetical protein
LATAAVVVCDVLVGMHLNRSVGRWGMQVPLMRDPATLQSQCVGCQRYFSPAEVQVRSTAQQSLLWKCRVLTITALLIVCMCGFCYILLLLPADPQ